MPFLTSQLSLANRARANDTVLGGLELYSDGLISSISSNGSSNSGSTCTSSSLLSLYNISCVYIDSRVCLPNEKTRRLDWRDSENYIYLEIFLDLITNSQPCLQSQLY